MIERVLLLCSLLAGQVAAAGGEDFEAEVRRLVRQLDAPQLAQREAAETELLGRGPAVLDLLPPAGDGESAEVRQRLGRIRQRLQQAAADQSTKASTITLHAGAMPLSEILRMFQKQSGNAIVDCRRQFDQPESDPKLKVDFEKTPFWLALDQLLDQAGLAFYPYGQQRAVGLVAAWGEKKIAPPGRACQSGPFRFEPVSIVARRDLRRPDAGSLAVTLEAAWEPRLRIISLVQRMADVRAVDEHGEPLPVADLAAQLEVPISGEAPAVKLNLPLELPPREVRQIARLKGKLWATIPGRIETFHFGKLVDAKNVQQRIAGVTVTLEQVRQSSPLPVGDGPGVRAGNSGQWSVVSGQSSPEIPNPQSLIPNSSAAHPHPNPLPKGEGTKPDNPLPKREGTAWEVRVTVRFDDAGDALASHRQWIFSNPAYLESRDGKRIDYDSFETTAQDKNEVGLAYLFRTDRPLDDFVFVYKTPGTIVASAFDYELKDLRLP